MSYIVQLEPGCWLADWVGDPGRTVVKESAKEYATKHAAKCALGYARQHRQFPHAELQAPCPPPCTKYVLLSYSCNELVDYTHFELADYDGKPYGDTVPFVVGSNQRIVAHDEVAPHVLHRMSAIDDERDTDTRMDTREQTTCAMVVKDVATKVLGAKPSTGGCKAFYTPSAYNALGHGGNQRAIIFIMHDGGDFAPLCYWSHEQYDLMEEFRSRLSSRGFILDEQNHYSTAVLRKKEKTSA